MSREDHTSLERNSRLSAEFVLYPWFGGEDMSNRKHTREAVLLLLLVAVMALSGCIGTDSKSIVIRPGKTEVELPLGVTLTVDLEIDPADAELSGLAEDPQIAQVKVLDHGLSFEGIGVGRTTVNVIAKKQGYKDSVLSYSVNVVDTDAPAILTIALSQSDHVTDSEQTVTVKVDTINVDDGTTIKAEFVDAEGEPLDPEIIEITTTDSNQATVTLIIPAHLVGNHLVRVSLDGATPRTADYAIFSSLSAEELEPEPRDTLDIQAIRFDPKTEYLSGEPLTLILRLTQEHGPVPDGDYAITIRSDLDGTLLEERAWTFLQGEAEVLVPTVLTTAGEHVLMVEAEGNTYSFELVVLPAAPARLRLIEFSDQGTANSPLSGPPTVVLVDEFGNTIIENNHLITVAVPGGFVSGTERVLTNSEGRAEFPDLTLHEGAYNLTFTYANLAGVSPLLVIGYEGSGEEHSPYLIHNLYGLNAIREDLTAHYRLANDIDASATAETDSPYWHSGHGWEPIGDFAGTLKGDHADSIYGIHDLFIHRPDSNRVALFASIAPSGAVSDVHLVSANITGKNVVGSLTGSNYGQITGCAAAETEVRGAADVGGLVGYNSGSITRSSATGNTTGLGLSLSSYAGGLVGSNRGIVTHSYARGSVAGLTIGGLVGYNQNHNNGVISTSYAAVELIGAGNRGGLTGLNLGSVSGSYSDQEVAGRTYGAGLHRSTADMKRAATYVGWNFTDIWDMDSSINDGYPFLRQ